jgi:hypothetical protein
MSSLDLGLILSSELASCGTIFWALVPGHLHAGFCAASQAATCAAHALTFLHAEC